MNFAGIEVPDGEDPELMMLIGQELQRRIALEAVIAEREQIELAQIYHSQPVQRAIDGVGPQLMAISPTLYLHYKIQERLDFTSAKDRNWLMQRFPEIKVPGQQTVKGTRGIGLPKPATLSLTPERNVRETKTYEQRN